MITILQLLILIPLAGFVVSLVIPQKDEKTLSIVAYLTAGIHSALITLFTIYWFIIGSPTLDHEDITLYKTDGYDFFIDLFFDNVTAVYLFVGSFLTVLVTVYSRYYLHREEGYK